jgi:hypothetical protein
MKMKSTGFLNTLRTEIIDAKNGNGKSVSTVKNYCNTVGSLLTVLEDNIVITSDSSKNATHNLSDIKLDTENREIFKELILDLNERKIVAHTEDTIPSLKEMKLSMQTTRTINQMINGRCIVIVNKEGFRKYVDQIKKIIDSADATKIKLKGAEKYRNGNEDISLKPLGIIIKGNHILKGDEKKKINVTDKALIYFLYYKSLNNSEECVSLKDLSTSIEINKAEGYIRNRIIEINKLVRQIISKNVKVRIGKFIKKELGRGYHLNPKILHKKSIGLKK